MQVKSIKVGNLETNCYILSENGNTIVIDPGDEFVKIKSLLEGSRLIAILLTHRHPDHIGALSDMVKFYGCPVYDRKNLEERRYDFCGMHLEFLYTPGHTSDSVSYYFYDYGLLFVGDFIFKGTIGRWDLPTGNFEEMQKSILKLKNYSDRTIIYPGHGDTTKLWDEKQMNPYIKNSL